MKNNLYENDLVQETRQELEAQASNADSFYELQFFHELAKGGEF